MTFRLRVFSPIDIVLDTPITQVDFEAVDGFFTLLPRHMDMVSALKSGILTYHTTNGKKYIACHKGVLVKKGEVVSVSTKIAVMGDDLKKLEEKIAIDFKEIEEERKEINLTMAKLEISLAKGIMNLKNGDTDHVGL